VIDEGAWGYADEFRNALEEKRTDLAEYVEALAKLAGVKE
jgi:hypothetical protein